MIPAAAVDTSHPSLLRALLEILPGAGVWAFDEQLRVVFAEGESPGDRRSDLAALVGLRLEDALPPHLSGALLGHCRAALAGQRSSLIVRSPSGDRVVDIEVSPIESAGDSVRGMMVARDVTEQESARTGREAAATILRAQDEERRLLADELHDDTIQVITAAMLSLDRGLRAEPQAPGTAAMREAREILSDAVDRARRMAFALRPPLLVTEGLAGALPKLIASQPGAGSVKVAVDRHPDAVESLVYRTVQEALAAIRRGGQSTRLDLSVCDDGPLLRAQLRHDGPAPDLRTTAERVRLAGGGFRQFSRAPGERQISFSVPAG